MDAGCLVCVLSIYKRKIGREDVRMRKRKMFRLVSVILCAVMLFTSESMSYIACAAPLSIKAASLHAEEPEGSMDAPSAETAETPGIQGDSGEEESTVTVKPVDETVTVPGDEEKKPTSSDNEDTEETDDDPADQNPGSENEDSPAPDTPEDYDAPEADESPTDDGSGSEKEEDPVTEEQMPVEEDKEPSGSVSDDSISTNTLESLTPGAELTDFVIVDEGGNVLDETQTVYLDQDKTRKFSVRPTPEDAVYSEVLWASDNSRVSVTDGTVALLPAPDDSVENVSLTATITAQIGEIKKTCKVEFLPLIEDVVIVDQDGNEVTEDGLTIEIGEQKKLSVKVLPEGASADVYTRWSSDDFDLNVDSNGVMYVNHLPNSLPATYHVTAEITVRSILQKTKIKKEFPVKILDSVKKPLCDDIQFTCPRMGTPKKIDDTTWEATVDKGHFLFQNINNIRISYTGNESGYDTIFYTHDGSNLSVSNGGWVSDNAKKYYSSGIWLVPEYPLQFVIGTKDYASYKLKKHSPVYTIRFIACKTEFSLSQTTLETIPAGVDRELTVKQLPDGAKMEDIVWTSGDERLVKIKDKTDKGVMLQFGQTVGSTEITAVVKDHKGQNCYAACTVKISMQIPAPEFSSESGGEIWEELPNGDYNNYWLIDNGGKLEMSVSVPGAKIYYTTNGTDPTVYGKLYQSPITIKTKTKVRAYAKLKGYQDSWDRDSEFHIGNPKISVSSTAVTMPQNSTRRINATVPSWADPEMVFWDSSNEDIAYVDYEDIVDSEGDVVDSKLVIVSGDTAGSCTITASYYDYADREQMANCRVTVTGKLEITREIKMTEEDSAEIRITKMPTGVPRDEIEWSVKDNTDYPFVYVETAPNGNGLVTVEQLPDTREPQTVTIVASAGWGDPDDIWDLESAYAYCEVTIIPRQYTVRFLGWNDKPAKIESLNRGQNATPPEDAVMRAAAPEGYLFDGWQNLSDCKNITKDTDIYAKPYVLKPFNITYMTGAEGSNPAANPTTYMASDKTFALLDAIPIDSVMHKFAGWYRDSRYDGNPIDEIPAGTRGDLTLYAKWAPAKTGLRIEPIADQPYTGKAINPEVMVYDGEKLLTPGTDYTIAYKNNTDAYMQAWDTPKKAPAVTVKGKGNYSGTDTAAFQIVPQSIAPETEEVVIPNLYLAYNGGKKLSVVPTVTWNGKELKNNSEFKVTSIVKIGDSTSTNILEKGCTEEGDYTVTISGVKNFSDTRDILLRVTQKALMSKIRFSKNKIADISWYELNGQTLKEKGINPVSRTGITLKSGKDELTEDEHYTVSYNENAKDVGIYDVIFTGKEENGYSGTVTKTFKITGTPLKASNLDFGKDWKTSMPYSGAQLEQTLHLSYKKNKNTLIPMVLGKDYTVAYENTTNASNKATVIITGINGYTDTVKKTFQIAPYSLKDTSAATLITTSLANGKDSVSYEKGGAKPKIIVKYGETVLTEGKDYTVTYKNNTKLASKEDTKAPSYTIKGKGNFKDSLPEKKFSIIAQDINKLSITAEDVMAAAPNTKKGETLGLTGKGKYKSTPKITDFNGKALSSGTDFLKTYTFTDENGVVLGPKDQVPEGSILTVAVEGTKNYIGETKVSYRVLAAKKSVAKASVSLKKGVSKEYSLEPVTLKKEDLVVKLNGVELSGDNYTIVSYMNNRKKGTAKVTIQGVGEYGGSKTVNFKINPRKVAWFKAP